jgi:hypothetical protein
MIPVRKWNLPRQHDAGLNGEARDWFDANYAKRRELNPACHWTIEVWTFDAGGFPGASSLDFGVFAHSCLPVFLILISARFSVFILCPCVFVTDPFSCLATAFPL